MTSEPSETPVATDDQEREVRLSLLVDHERNRDLLADWLATGYDVTEPDEPELGPEVDCCLVDGPGFAAHREAIRDWKESEHPRFAPVLLVADEPLSEEFEPAAWDDVDGLYIVDDVVEVPVEKTVLHRRLENLVTRRSLSQDLSRRYERSEERFSALFHATPNPSLVVDDDAVVRYVNDAFCERYGVDRDAVLDVPVADLIGFETDTRAAIADAADQAMDASSVTLEAVPFTTPDGEERFADVDARALTIGDRGGATIVLRDVTERLTRERELAASERQFRSLFEASNDALLIADDDGDILEANPAACELVGLDRAAVLDRNITAFAGADYDFASAWERFLEVGSMEGEFDFQRPDGEERILEFTATANVQPGKHLSALRDVTVRRSVERELSETRERLAEILDRIDAGFYAVDDDWTITYFNAQAGELLGVDAADVAGAAFWDVFPTAIESSFREPFESALATQEPVTVEAYSRPVDGWLEAHASPSEGGLSVFFRDVTDRVEREQALAAAQERFQQIAENVHEVIWMASPDLETIQYVSSGIEELIGAEPAAIEGESVGSFLALLHEDDRPEAEELADRLVREVADGSAAENYHGEFRLHGADGLHWIEIDAYPVLDDGPERIVGLIGDITDTKRRERELERQNARLEEFAGIVSHDLRNPLQVIASNVALLREDVAEADHLDAIDRSVDRMQRLIEDLLALARDETDAHEVAPVQLDAVVTDAWRTVETSGATLETDVTGVAEADRSRLVQCFENLFRNAVEHGGDDVTVSVGTLPDGLFVADDGPGIPPDERDAVFDVGYTTRTDGTGFGLNIVQDVVDAHGWEITVEESEAGGARFEIRGLSQ